MARRQTEIPGTERKAIKEIDDAADAYVKERDKRMRLSKKEKEAKQALMAVMRKHNQLVYRDDNADPPVTITLSSKDDVKVTSARDDEHEDEGDEDGPM